MERFQEEKSKIGQMQALSATQASVIQVLLEPSWKVPQSFQVGLL